MKKTQTPILTPVALALITALGLSACGKNMNLKLNGAKATTGTKPGGDGGPNNNNHKEGGGASNGTDDKNKTGSTSSAGATGTITDSAEYPDLDGKLQPLSVWDLTKDPLLTNGNPFPYLNNVKDDKGNTLPGAIRHIGDDQDAVISRSNLVFRAIKHVPKKEHVQSVDKFELVFKGVRLYNAKGVDRKALAKQVLCMLDTRTCSGEKDDSDVNNLNQLFWVGDTSKADNLKSKDFAEKSVPVELLKNADGSVIMSNETVELDLLKAFGLDKKTAAEQIEWIEKNSTPFTNPDKAELGYRKFRFVIANNVHIESGQLILSYTLTKDASDKKLDVWGKPADAGDYQNDEDDRKDGSKIVATAAETDVKKDAASATPTPTPTPTPALEQSPATAKTDGTETGKVTKIIIPAPIVNPVVIPAKPVTAEDKDNQAKKVDISLDLYDLVLKFQVNKADLSKKDGEKLLLTAKVLSDAGQNLRKVFITGHTSVTGSKKLNDKLSKDRATAVAQKLLKGKLSKTMMDAPKGMGSPKVSSCDPVRECQRDRKVMIKISLSDKLKGKNADPTALERVRGNLIEALREIWEANTEVAGQ